MCYTENNDKYTDLWFNNDASGYDYIALVITEWVWSNDGIITGENWNTGKKPVPLSLCPSQSHMDCPGI